MTEDEMVGCCYLLTGHEFEQILKYWEGQGSLACYSPWDSQESSPTPQFKSINSSALSLLHSPTHTSIHDNRKNNSVDQPDLCWQSNVSAFEYAI